MANILRYTIGEHTLNILNGLLTVLRTNITRFWLLYKQHMDPLSIIYGP